MKLQNLIYATMVACAFSACSNDDDPNIPDPALELDATLTAQFITVGDAGSSLKSTKAEGDDALFNTIGKVGIAVFNNGAMGGAMAVGTLIDYGVKDNENNITSTISAKSGDVSVLVIANPVEGMFNGENTLESFLGKINSEAINSDALLMSSKVYNVTLKKGKNVMASSTDGFVDTSNDELVGRENVKLYRNVARVEVPTIKVYPREGFGRAEGATFTLKAIFVANVRTSVRVGGLEKGNGLFNASLKWCSVVNQDGVLSGNTEPGGGSPYYKDLSSVDGISYTGPDAAEKDLTEDNAVQIFVNDNASSAQISATNEDNKATLLVIKGDYEYTTATGENVKSENAYWTVPINNVSITSGDKDFPQHFGVLRNVKYVITPTITGPGSGIITPEETGATLTAKIEVANWGEVVLTPDID